MIPQTVGRAFDVGRVAPVQCVKNDTLKDLGIKGTCFLMLLVYEGSARFCVGEHTFETTAPCFVCFDEREAPRLVRKRRVKCDAVYFHPQFLNINMTFERVHEKNYEQIALNHDLFLLKPFTDEERYVFPVPDAYAESLTRLFCALSEELKEQKDWYWSCRSRSYFMEMILLLEKSYGITELSGEVERAQNKHLKDVLAYIESRYGEPIGLEDLTGAASVNHSTLTRLFKAELNATPMEYLWQYRIGVAKKHLEFTSLPIKDIAARCGFRTIQHFSRKFEACTGQTPTAFRDAAVGKRKSDFRNT